MSKAGLAATTAVVLWLGVSPAYAAPPAGGGRELEELIVTAQRREENLLQVPASVTSLSANLVTQLGVKTTEDLTVVVPGLLWGRSTNFNQPTIRGVGSRNGGASDEPNVASYVDGVYQPDQTGTVFELTNIERIEVLKGPQGTLFGRNATGGAINVITSRPQFTLSGNLQASYGRFDYRKIGAFVTGPIVDDKVAGSISAVAYADDGYVHNVYLDKTQGKNRGLAIRPKLLFQPTSKLRLELNGFYGETDNNVLLSLYAYNGNSAARPVASRPVLNPKGLPLDRIVAGEPYTTAGAFVPKAYVTKHMVDGHLSYDFGWATLDGLLAHGATRTSNASLTEASPLILSGNNYLSKSNYWVTDWVLASPSGGDLTWIVGTQGFLYHIGGPPALSYTRNTTTGAFTASSIISHGNTHSAALFGEATWQAIPNLYLTGGLRYTWDRKEAFGQINTAAPVLGEETFEKLSPRFVARYEFSPTVNVYASYTQGFKAGIFATASSTPVDPETIDAYEVGMKADIANRLRLTAAAYHYDYRDLQMSAIVIIGGASRSVIQNAGEVKINGFEANLTAFITSDFFLDAAASLLDTEIHDFPNAVVQVPVGGRNGNTTASANVTGNELIRAPDYTFSLAATYRRRIAEGELTLSANAFFSGAYWAEIGNRLKQPAYTVVNASATWRSDRGYYVTVFGQNLADEVYAVGWLTSTFTDATQAAKPRWFGVTVGYDF